MKEAFLEIFVVFLLKKKGGGRDTFILYISFIAHSLNILKINELRLSVDFLNHRYITIISYIILLRLKVHI